MASRRQPTGDVIPLPMRQFFKLHEPIILLKALNEAAKNESETTDTPGEGSRTGDLNDPSELFRTFVYKLAHVCDSVRGDGGATTTSFMVLRSERPETQDDIVHYWFASNQRSTKDLKNTRAYVHALLLRIHQAPETLEPTNCDILQQIILFNRKKLSWYLSQAKIHATKCLAQRSRTFDSADQGGLVDDALVNLLVFLNSADIDISDDASDGLFIHSCERIIRRLNRLEASTAGDIITQHVKNLPRFGQPSGECWHDFKHAMNRIIAYPRSLQCMLKTKVVWPALFRDFQVYYVPSSRASEDKRWRNSSLFAENIVGRMTRRQSDIELFREYVRDLQVYNLDDRITNEFKHHFRPIVHSELLLLNLLEFSGNGISADRFFQGNERFMYIGSSKPLCRFCQYYFEEHHSNVRHRETHGNLYISARLPDTLKSQGQAGLDSRDKMLDRMCNRFRVDAFSLINQRVMRSWKGNDSNTFSDNITLRDGFSTSSDGTVTDLDDLENALGGVSLRDVDVGHSATGTGLRVEDRQGIAAAARVH